MTKPIAPLRTLSYILIALLAFNALWAVRDISLIADELSLLERIEQGGIVTFAEGNASDERRATSAAGVSLLIVATVVIWCVWQFRGQRNLSAAGRAGMRFTPGWAVGWWFIPIANLWKPFQTVRELWSRSDPNETSYEVRGWWVIGLWWAMWIVSNITIWYSTDPPSVRDQIAADQREIVGNVATIAAAALAIVIVRSIESRQARLRPWEPPPPARPDAGMDPLPLPPA